MSGKAEFGRWVVIFIVVVIALSELAIAALSLQAGRFQGSQIGRVLVTGWLLWQVWEGAGWARWLMAGLFLVAAVFAVGLGFSSPGVEGRPEVVALLAGLGALFVILGLGLASPWVGAYQATRRGNPSV